VKVTGKVETMVNIDGKLKTLPSNWSLFITMRAKEDEFAVLAAATA